MTYNKRRYRRVHVPFPITHTRVGATKLTLLADGSWWVNAPELTIPGRPFNVPLYIAFQEPEWVDSDTRWHRKNGSVRVRTWQSFSPNHFKRRRVPFEERFSRFPYFRVPV